MLGTMRTPQVTVICRFDINLVRWAGTVGFRVSGIVKKMQKIIFAAVFSTFFPEVVFHAILQVVVVRWFDMFVLLVDSKHPDLRCHDLICNITKIKIRSTNLGMFSRRTPQTNSKFKCPNERNEYLPIVFTDFADPFCHCDLPFCFEFRNTVLKKASVGIEYSDMGSISQVMSFQVIFEVFTACWTIRINLLPNHESVAIVAPGSIFSRMNVSNEYAVQSNVT